MIHPAQFDLFPFHFFVPASRIVVKKACKKQPKQKILFGSSEQIAELL